MGSSQETSIFLHSHNTRQDKIVSKFVVREGRSVLLIQSKDLPPSQHLNLWMWELFTAISLSQSFAQLCLSQYQSCLHIVTLTTRVNTLVAEIEPRCHRVMPRVDHQQAAQLLSHIYYPMDTHQLTSPQGKAAEPGGGMTLQALGGLNSPCGWCRNRRQPFSLEVRHTHTDTHTHSLDNCPQSNSTWTCSLSGSTTMHPNA